VRSIPVGWSRLPVGGFFAGSTAKEVQNPCALGLTARLLDGTRCLIAVGKGQVDMRGR
jgi:hypothetical protein